MANESVMEPEVKSEASSEVGANVNDNGYEVSPLQVAVVL